MIDFYYCVFNFNSTRNRKVCQRSADLRDDGPREGALWKENAISEKLSELLAVVVTMGHGCFLRMLKIKTDGAIWHFAEVNYDLARRFFIVPMS